MSMGMGMGMGMSMSMSNEHIVNIIFKVSVEVEGKEFGTLANEEHSG